MVEVPPVSQDALAWTLEWLAVPLSGESEIVKADELARLHRELVDRSAQDPHLAGAAATAAASVAVQLFDLLVERDPQAAGQYLRDLRAKLGSL